MSGVPVVLTLGLWFLPVALSVSGEPVSIAPRSGVAQSSFGIFPAETQAERQLEAMLEGPEDQIDLALANWLIASDLPEFQDMTREEYFELLSEAESRVRYMIDKARGNPAMAGDMNDPERLAYVFCSAIIALGIDYKEEFKKASGGPTDTTPIYRDANNVFLAGLLGTGEGSCVSMPMLYLVIGERLGLPVHLVTVGQHFFIRWDEPAWRMNIETTIVEKVSMTPDEDYYLEVEHLTREELKEFDDLKNLGKRSVIGKLMHARSACFLVKKPRKEREYWRDLYRAHLLAPHDRNITICYRHTTGRIEAKRREQARSQRRHQSIGRIQPWVPNPKPPLPKLPQPVIPHSY